jgi:hypothetical protein
MAGRALCLIAVVGPFVAPPQDPTAEQIVERMEKAASAARGSTFSFLANAPWTGATLHRVSLEVARDGSVRIHQPGPNSGRWREMVLAKSAIYDVYDDLSSLAHVSTRHSVRRSAERFTPADVDRIDPFIQNSGGGAWIPWSWHPWFHALSPRWTFQYERNLKVAGRRRVDGEECFVLLSHRPLDYVTTAPKETRGYDGLRRKFFVRTSDYSLKRVVEVLQWPRSAPHGAQYDFGPADRGIPAHMLPPGANNPLPMVDIRRGLELDGTALLPPASDLYATKARCGDVADRLAKSPDDPDLVFSEAILESHRRYGGEQKAKPFDEKFTKAVAKSWTPTPVRNLLSLLVDTGDIEGLKPLLARVEADPAMAKATALERVQGWMHAGVLDKADRALKEFTDDREPLPVLRVELALRRKDYAGAVADFVKWPLPPGEWGQAHRTGKFIGACWKVKGLSYEGLFKALDSAIAAQPDSVALHSLRMQLLYQLDDPERIANSIREAFAASKDPCLTQPAISMMQTLITLRDSFKAMDPERVKAARPALRKALDAGEGRPCIAGLRGLLLKSEEDKEGAIKEFEKELVVLSKTDRPESYAVVWIAAAAMEWNLEDLLVRTSITRLDHCRKRGEAYVHYGGENDPNPVLTLLVHYGSKGQFEDLYKTLRGVRLSSGFGALWDPANRVPRMQIGEGLMAAARKEQDPSTVRWFAEMILGAANNSASVFGFEALEFLERIRELEPDNLENLQRLADRHAALKSDDAAIRTIEEVLAKAKGIRRGVWTPTEGAVLIAERQLARGNRKEALAALDGVEWEREELASWLLWKAGELYEGQGEPAKAASLFARTEENGYRPFLRLAQIAFDRQDWVEALRQANRANAEGFTSFILPPNKSATAEQWQEQARTGAPLELREQILRKAGDLYFIDRLLASKLPALSESETARARKALADLEKGTIPEREAALKEFRALGPGSALLLRKVLADEDSIWRTGAKAILQEWAEPR